MHDAWNSIMYITHHIEDYKDVRLLRGKRIRATGDSRRAMSAVLSKLPHGINLGSSRIILQLPIPLVQRTRM